MEKLGLLRINAYVTRGNGKAKLTVAFNDKSLSDGQCAILAMGYLEHVLKQAHVDPDDMLVDATYDPASGVQ